MSPQLIFPIQLVLGYVACLLCFFGYAFPRLRALSPVDAQRAIATLHSFRFFGLAFLVTGVVGPHLPAGFARSAALGDLATGVLALLALLTLRVRPLFWLFVAAYNLVGLADLILNYVHAARLGLPALSGQLGALYVIPVVIVPALVITHIAALYFLLRPQPHGAAAPAGKPAFVRI